MDPQKCWEEICQAFDEHRRKDALLLIASLLDWLDRGGMPPQVTSFSNQETLAWMTRTLCQRLKAKMSDWE